jgi:hypothetical protein
MGKLRLSSATNKPSRVPRGDLNGSGIYHTPIGAFHPILAAGCIGNEGEVFPGTHFPRQAHLLCTHHLMTFSTYPGVTKFVLGMEGTKPEWATHTAGVVSQSPRLPCCSRSFPRGVDGCPVWETTGVPASHTRLQVLLTHRPFLANRHYSGFPG